MPQRITGDGRSLRYNAATEEHARRATVDCVLLAVAMLEMGLDTFGDVVFDSDGRPVTQAQALRNVVAEGVLAEQVGVDAFGVGEHHRADFSVSAPEVVLAAIAGKTERILLGSAVTILSTDD